MSVPPEISPTIAVTKKWRWKYSGGSNGTTPFPGIGFTPQMLGVLVMAASSSICYGLLSAVRIKKVELWALNTTGRPAEMTVDWSANTPLMGSRSTRVTSTTLGVSNVAHLKATPPPNSLASFWIEVAPNGANRIFNVSANETTELILDLTLEVVVHDSLLDGPSSPIAVSGATPGQVYLTYLNGTLEPVGYISIAV